MSLSSFFSPLIDSISLQRKLDEMETILSDATYSIVHFHPL